MPSLKKHILILGGGFTGIKTAQTLVSQNIPNTEITLITPNPNFEYHAAFYRVVTGRSPKQVSVPIKSILKSRLFNLVIDRITSLDLKKQKVTGDAKVSYNYDYLVIALGSQTNFFNLKGIRQNSFQLKTLADAQKLKSHIQHMVQTSNSDPERCLHFSIVGGGPTGVELAGELGNYVSSLSCKNSADCTCMQIDLIEGSDSILKSLGGSISQKAENRLKELGVNILKNTFVEKENKDKLFTSIGNLTPKTVIWVAGVTTHALLKQTADFVLQPNGKPKIMDNLSVFGFPNVFIGGDNANLSDSGTALSAFSHGDFIAKEIINSIFSQKASVYKPIKNNFTVPIGSKWAVSKLGPFVFSGYLGWLVRKTVDLWFFSTILPFPKALKAVTIK